MNLVFIYGPPGVGKLTVARELSRLTGYKVFHNHLSLNASWSVFDPHSKAFERVLHGIRDLVFDEAAKAGVDLIFTCVYRAEVNDAYLDRIYELVEGQAGRICPVQLVCDRDILDQRVLGEGRQEMGKVASVESERWFFEKYGPFPSIPGRESLIIDNSHIPPDEAARQIAAHYGLPSAG
jgi:hypothetical protein